MKQILYITKYILISFIFISCNTKLEEGKNQGLKDNLEKSKILSYSFPDTVKINTVIKGNIRYDISNLPFDADKINDRFLELLLSTNTNKELAEYKDVDKNRLLSYVDSIPTGKFNFVAVFEDKGNQTLNIVIRDNMFLKPENNTPEDKITLRTADCVFSKDVFVIE